MKKLLGILIAFLIIGTSQASTTLIPQNGNVHFGKPTHIVAQPQTAIRSVPVYVKKIQKPKLFVGSPRRLYADDSDYDGVDVDDLITPYRRRDLNKIEHDEGISDNVRWRLFLARQLAMMKYREKFGNINS